MDTMSVHPNGDDYLEWLQDLLDRSFARSSGHLTSIMEPQRRLSAERLAADLAQMVILAVATVTAAGEPRVSAVDGHFIAGRWWFGTSAASAKARHLAARPAVSAAYTPRDGYGVFTHGTAVPVDPDAPASAGLIARLNATYGHGPEGWPEPVAFYRIDPSWMTAFAMEPGGQAQPEETAGQAPQD
jgi:hypothetical protein